MSPYAAVWITLATLAACESPRESRTGTATRDSDSADARAAAEAVDSAAPSGQRIGYEVVKQWTIGPNGYGRVIVIEPRYRNEADLRASERS
jgi:hypothetical protein